MKNMRRCIGLASLLILLAAASCSKKQQYTPKAKVASSFVPTADAEMAAAIAKARESLPRFWEALQQPEHGETNFALKVRFNDTNTMEYVWLGEVSRQNTRTLGTVGGGPLTVHCISQGQRVTINEADIGDWSYDRDGKTFGNYTIRALFKVMPEKDVEYFKRKLAEP